MTASPTPNSTRACSSRSCARMERHAFPRSIGGAARHYGVSTTSASPRHPRWPACAPVGKPGARDAPSRRPGDGTRLRTRPAIERANSSASVAIRLLRLSARPVEGPPWPLKRPPSQPAVAPWGGTLGPLLPFSLFFFFPPNLGDPADARRKGCR